MYNNLKQILSCDLLKLLNFTLDKETAIGSLKNVKHMQKINRKNIVSGIIFKKMINIRQT